MSPGLLLFFRKLLFPIKIFKSWRYQISINPISTEEKHYVSLLKFQIIYSKHLDFAKEIYIAYWMCSKAIPTKFSWRQMLCEFWIHTRMEQKSNSKKDFEFTLYVFSKLMPEHCPCHDSDQQIININFVPSAHRWMILISTDLQYFSRLRYIYSKRVNKPRLIESANSSNLYFIQASGALDCIGSYTLKAIMMTVFRTPIMSLQSHV